jgi:nucleoside-diphosphate-sugar epimerase
LEISLEKKIRVLLLGAQGYLGTSLNKYLLDHDFQVTAVDQGTFRSCVLGSMPEEENIIQEKCENLQKRHFEGFDVLINLASNSNDPLNGSNSKKYYEEGIKFSMKFADWCKELSIKYVFPSSCSVYGRSSTMCSEDTPTKPITDYSKSKVAIEEYLQSISDDSFSPTILRLATVFGFSYRMRFDIVLNMLTGMAITGKKVQLNSDGQSWRPHVYIKDVLEAFRCVARGGLETGKAEIFNVGNNSNNLTILQSAQIVIDTISGGVIEKLEVKADSLFFDRKISAGKDARDYRVNFDKIYEQLPNFTSLTSVEEGVRELSKELISVGLNRELFEDRRYYRLQYLEQISNKYFLQQ